MLRKTHHERAVRVLESSMSGKDGVVGFDDRVGQGGGRVDTELQLGFLAVIRRETLKNESTETGTSSTTERVENEEALKTRAVVCKATNFVHHGVNLFLSDSIMTASVYNILSVPIRKSSNQFNQAIRTVASSIFLARNKSLGVKEAPVWTVPYFIDDVGLQVDVKRTGYMLSSSSLREESAEAIIVLRGGALNKATIGLKCV